MKARAMISASVAQSDAFLSMSIESQWLYLMLLFETDVVGRILGIQRIIRGYGLDTSCLDELIDSGFLLKVDGHWYDRHTWRNNKFSAKIATRAQNDDAIASGILKFESESFKSSYVRVTPGCDTETPKSNESTTERHVMQYNAPAPTPAPAPALSPSTSNSTPPNGAEESRPCMCKKCGNTHASFTIKDGATTITCPDCGAYVMER